MTTTDKDHQSTTHSEGGETVFYPFDRRSVKDEIAVSPETGMLLLHKHGDDCMLVSCRGHTSRNGLVFCTRLCAG